MIDYDYIMKKYDGQSINQYTPLFDKKISNVAKLKGHNSSGKTTLMDMIALSFYGRQSSNVIPKLQDKLKYLQEAENSEFDFTMTVDNGDRFLRATVKKTGYFDGNKCFESVVEESMDGKNYCELIKEEFLKKYRVIYDMPDRPMERIQELVKEADHELRADMDMLDSIRYPLSNIISDVQSSRNDELIGKIQLNVNKLKEQIAQKEIEQKNLNSLYSKLVKYDAAITLKSERDHYNQINARLVALDKYDKKKKTEDRKNLKKYSEEENKVKKCLMEMIFDHNKVVQKIDKISKIQQSLLNKYSSFWQNATPERIISMGCGQIFDYTKASNDLVNQIDEVYGGADKQVLSEKKKMIRELIGVLEPYTRDKMSVLETSVGELYNKLVAEFGIISKDVIEYDEAMAIKKNAILSRDNGIEANKKYEVLGPKPIEDEYDDDLRDQLEQELTTTGDKLRKIEVVAETVGVSFDNYADIIDGVYSDPFLSKYCGWDSFKIKNELASKSQDIKMIDGKIGDLKHSLKDAQDTLDEAQSKEIHPLSKYSKELSTLKKIIESDMLPEMKKKETIISDLSAGKSIKVTDGNSIFLESVWTYLGNKLNTIQHVGKTYKVDKIDMNSREVISGNVHICFKDMGTGESQMAYLLGLLNSDDPRTVIALFDEVDHMDPKVISKIQTQLKKMMDDGKLLLGLMAAPGDGTEVDCFE